MNHNPEDTLTLEVVSRTNNVVVAGKLVKAGKNRLDILAKDFPLFSVLVEEELADLNRHRRNFARALEHSNAALAEKCESNKDKRDAQYINGLVMVRKEGPEARFRKDHFRDPKPFDSVTIVACTPRKSTKEEILEREAQEDRKKTDLLLSLVQGRNDVSEVDRLRAELEEVKALLKAQTRSK